MKNTTDRAENAEIGRLLMYYDKTIALLRCGVDDETAKMLADIFRADGWYVYEVSEEYFASHAGERIGGITVICDAAKLPRSLEEPLERYLTQNGRLFIFGGPLFGLDDLTEDSVHIEGVSPLYKTYKIKDADVLMTLPQAITAAEVSGNIPYAICPNVRPDGAGFGMNRRCRMLPILGIERSERTENDRPGMSYGAYFVLSDSIGHLVCTPGTRHGNVSPITLGNEVAVIGFSLETALDIGAEKLISDMMRSLGTGIFLFEAGTEKYVIRPGENMKVGAKIISASRDFTEVTVRFSVGDISVERKVLATGQNYTKVHDELPSLPEGTYIFKTELTEAATGRVLDRAEEEIFVTNGVHSTDRNDFIRVENGDFMLGDKKWYMYGFNYFPLYHVSLELNDYWRGAFDKSNYIASEVEKDLRHMKNLGMNTVSIRIDCNSFDNVIDPLRDFFARCARLGLRVMMSFCNITNPLFFNESSEKAFAEFMERLNVADDPTLLAHDIFWEGGESFVIGTNSVRRSEDWVRWLRVQYGSLENAEKSFGEPLDRSESGTIICPSRVNYDRSLEKSRKKMAAFTRFLTDTICRKWNDTVTALKKYDSNHLYTNRIGVHGDKSPNLFLSPTAKYRDFMCLEAYTFTGDKYGLYASAALDRAASYVSGGKPVTWVEYGMNLTGMSGLAVGTKILWNAEDNRPLDSRLEEQRLYQEQFHKMFRLCDVKGTLPWFYAGGFRFTEHSDCGYVNPDGTLRPAAEDYADIGTWFLGERADSRKTEYVEVDPEGELAAWCKIIFGDGTFNKFVRDRAMLENKAIGNDRVPGPGLRAAERADKKGGSFEFKTPGDGTTSADTPLVLCGNAEFKGYGPLKYLNGEFNYIRFTGKDGAYTVYPAHRGVLRLPKGAYRVEASVGNLAAAKWLSGDRDGCAAVAYSFGGSHGRLYFSEDVPYLADGTAAGSMELSESGKFSARLTAIGRADFGELFEFDIEIV